jgi:hypothetical protein
MSSDRDLGALFVSLSSGPTLKVASSYRGATACPQLGVIRKITATPHRNRPVHEANSPSVDRYIERENASATLVG